MIWIAAKKNPDPNSTWFRTIKIHFFRPKSQDNWYIIEIYQGLVLDSGLIDSDLDLILTIIDIVFHSYLTRWFYGRHILRIELEEIVNNVITKFHLSRCKQMLWSNQIIYSISLAKSCAVWSWLISSITVIANLNFFGVI